MVKREIEESYEDFIRHKNRNEKSVQEAETNESKRMKQMLLENKKETLA